MQALMAYHAWSVTLLTDSEEICAKSLPASGLLLLGGRKINMVGSNNCFTNGINCWWPSGWLVQVAVISVLKVEKLSLL